MLQGHIELQECNSNKSQSFKVGRNSIFRKKSKMAAIFDELLFTKPSSLAGMKFGNIFELFPGGHDPSKWPEMAFSEKNPSWPPNHVSYFLIIQNDSE